MTHLTPKAQGLYDPRHEHDACGVGFVVDLKGRATNGIVQDAIQVLLNLEHRGACGCEVNTGDGAGILLQVPHKFLAKEADRIAMKLPAAGRYGVGMLFLPKDEKGRKDCEAIIEKVVKDEGQRVIGWRTVPVDNSMIGPSAIAAEPVVRQLFIERASSIEEDMAFERKLYVIRRGIENAIWSSQVKDKELFYIPSLSYKTVVYKGMLTASQLTLYFPDLRDSSVEAALALVHSRFSTNTFPNWARAHPYRYIAHNGEINTLRGNVNWMKARESMFESELMGNDVKKIRPVIDESGSDSAMFDNALEMLSLTGRTLPHSMMMMIPEPWSNHESMSAEKKAFYEYHSALM